MIDSVGIAALNLGGMTVETHGPFCFLAAVPFFICLTGSSILERRSASRRYPSKLTHFPARAASVAYCILGRKSQYFASFRSGEAAAPGMKNTVRSLKNYGK
jgi:hypothetical protein